MHELLLAFSLVDVCAKNGHTGITRGINSRLEPAIPLLVILLKAFWLLRLDRTEQVLVKIPSDCVGINFPDVAADHLFAFDAGARRSRFVDVNVAPFRIQRGEGIAHAGQSGLALLKQIADLVLALSCTQRGAGRTD